MPQGVFHIFFPLLSTDVLRSKLKGKLINRKMVLVAGISGVLPDIDIPAYFLLSHFFNLQFNQVHRTFTHTLLVPLLGLVAAWLLFKTFKKKNYYLYAIMFAFGTLTHLVLDLIVNGTVMPFYPFSNLEVGLDLIRILAPTSNFTFRTTILAGLDAAILTMWLIYQETKNNIKKYA